MNRRVTAAALLLALTLVGCSKSPAKLPVQLSTETFKQVDFASTMEILAPGRYYIDVASGKVQSWQAPGNAKLTPTPDLPANWVTADDGATVYWLNRATGATHTWQRSELRAIASGQGKLLLQGMKGETPTNTFYVTDESFSVQRSFTVDVAKEDGLSALFAPDGSAVAITAWRQATAAGEAHSARAYLVTLKNGNVQELDKQPDSLTGGALSVRAISAGPTDWLVTYQGGTAEPSGLYHYSSVIRRYDWQGKHLGEYTVNGNTVQPSPDGKLLTVYADLDHLAPAALVADAATGKPLFRVAGISPGKWLSDSSALMLSNYVRLMMVTRSGELKSAPAVPRTEAWAVDMSVKPAPDDSNRFIAGMAVVDGTGKLIYEVKLPQRDWLVWGLEWGASSKELILTIYEPTGKGNLGWDFPLPPRVQKAPFSDPYVLQVDDPKGECLNLRANHSTSGPKIRCLPSGTKLAVGDLSQAPEKLNQGFYYEQDHFWFWVRTEQGETGWVSGSTGSLRWAD